MEQKQAEQLRDLIIDLERLNTKIVKAENFGNGTKTVTKQYEAKARKIAKILNVDSADFIAQLNK